MIEHFIDKEFNVFSVNTTTWTFLEKTFDRFKYPKINELQQLQHQTLPTDQLAQYAIDLITVCPIPQRRHRWINKLDTALTQLQQYGGDSAKRAQAIQEQLIQRLNMQNWKSALIVSPAPAIFHCPTPVLRNTINASTLVTLSTDNFPFLNSHSTVFAIMGSSFITNKASLIAARQPNSTHHSMDAFYVQYLPDGVVFALADGCGGHIDSDQDQRILLSAQTSVQTACQLAQQYRTAEELKANAASLIQNVSQRISQVAPIQPAESTTLLVGRVFQESGNFSRLVAINIGDGMLAAVTPQLLTAERLTFKTVAPACTTQMGTAMLPHGYKPQDVLVYEADCIPGTILLPMSDGVYDYLPKGLADGTNVSRPTNIQNLEGFTLTYLDEQNIASHLREHGGLLTEKCILTLAEVSISNLNEKRITSLQHSQQITQQLPQVQTRIQGELAGMQNEQKNNDELWGKVENLPVEEQQAEKERLSLIDKKLKTKRQEAESFLREFVSNQEFTLGDDFTIVGIPVF